MTLYILKRCLRQGARRRPVAEIPHSERIFVVEPRNEKIDDELSHRRLVRAALRARDGKFMPLAQEDLQRNRRAFFRPNPRIRRLPLETGPLVFVRTRRGVILQHVVKLVRADAGGAVRLGPRVRGPLERVRDV